MSPHRPVLAFAFASVALATTIAATTGCGPTDTVEPALDAAPPAPVDPTGRYELASTFSLAAPPAAATGVLDDLLAATDGPDDPSRYLIDLMIERLPEGRTRTYAASLAPYVAAYVNERLDEVAPGYVPGARALSAGLARIAHRFGTVEELVIDGNDDAAGTLAEASSGVRRRTAWRTIVGLRFAPGSASGAPGPAPAADAVEVRFAALGLPDTAATTQIVLAADARGATASLAPGTTFAIDPHAIALPYTALLRVGLDHAVIPRVVPGAHDLADALATLVDCDHLGALVSEWVGLGSPSFYARGCTLGLTALAARIYARIDGIDAVSVALELGGSVRAADTDRDGLLDELADGVWTGAFAGSPVTGGFAGTRP